MLKTLTATAVLLAATTTAHAAPADGDVLAVYHPATQRYCLQASMLHPADPSRGMLYRNTCLNHRQWKARGIVFDRPEAVQLASRR